MDAIFENWKKDIDFVWGATKAAPKFPLPAGHQFLLHYHHLTHNADALKAVLVTLDKMSEGGIYDQIGGGFSRYSVDGVWKVPHFEKMLYDNAQLVDLLVLAWQHSRKPLYRQRIEETITWLMDEMIAENGAFAATLASRLVSRNSMLK